jgi:hypothetical protein
VRSVPSCHGGREAEAERNRSDFDARCHQDAASLRYLARNYEALAKDREMSGHREIVRALQGRAGARDVVLKIGAQRLRNIMGGRVLAFNGSSKARA